jgi:hypothetical protein
MFLTPAMQSLIICINYYRTTACGIGNLLNRCTSQNLYRGFESPPLRQISPNCFQQQGLTRTLVPHFCSQFCRLRWVQFGFKYQFLDAVDRVTLLCVLKSTRSTWGIASF